MYCFSIKAYSESASFRLPETHTFQKTLPLPPLTSIIGLLGAAMGLSHVESMEFYYSNCLKVGIIGTSQSRANDLWKYQKIKSKETLSAVLTREILFELDLELFIAAESKKVISNVKEAVVDPRYALSAGCSDDLLKVRKVGQVVRINPEPLHCFSNTILPGDQSGNYKSDIDITKIPLSKEVYPPRVYILPVEFDITSNGRRVRRREPFTFIDTPIKLIRPVLGLKLGQKSVALL
ncbi:MAG: CRISPR-associated protein Cas5 [Syntrophomonadaceae bacterium]|jgi:CRISPR-associated protein Cas5t